MQSTWLKDEWMCVDRISQIKKIFSKNEWKLIQSTFEANFELLIENLKKLKGDSDRNFLLILEKILKWVNYFKEENKSIEEIFKGIGKEAVKFINQYLNEIGELAAKSLYGKICLEIVQFGELKGKRRKEPKDTKKILNNLWKGLREGDDKKSLTHANQLKKNSEENVIHYTQLISDLQHERMTLSNQMEKLELLIKVLI